MIYQEGYVYHIKDEYFEKVQDSNLMQNKEGGTYRPTFYCLRDNKTSLLWMVSLSSRVEKFKAIHDKQMAKYGKCLTIVLGEFDGKEAAFLLQNMFPIRDYYLDHIHSLFLHKFKHCFFRRNRRDSTSLLHTQSCYCISQNSTLSDLFPFHLFYGLIYRKYTA